MIKKLLGQLFLFILVTETVDDTMSIYFMPKKNIPKESSKIKDFKHKQTQIKF